jgi:hypothetical protein
LNKKLKWDGKNMSVTNISDNDMISVVTSNKFTVINGDPRFDTKKVKVNALESSEEWIKHTYREGWTL